VLYEPGSGEADILTKGPFVPRTCVATLSHALGGAAMPPEPSCTFRDARGSVHRAKTRWIAGATAIPTALPTNSTVKSWRATVALAVALAEDVA
jgi:hypothetical protein